MIRFMVMVVGMVVVVVIVMVRVKVWVRPGLPGYKMAEKRK